MTGPVFDARPLSAPVPRAAVRAYLRAQPGASTGAIAGIVIGVVALGIVGVVVVPTALVLVVTVFTALTGAGSGWAALLFLALLLLMAGLAAWGVVALVRRSRSAGERSYRLDWFARANAMTQVLDIPDPPLPGMIFDRGGSRHASNAIRGQRPRFVEFANYRYTTGSGKNQTTHHWGYVAIKLDVPLPHIVLDALSNNGLFGASNLPASFDTHQRLSLEGDFDRYFALYCPEGYERDALYLFTPDIMARFIDSAAALDVEIVDDWLFLYTKREVSTLDPAMWQWLFSVVAALLEKLEQWSRWRDERLDAGAAAPRLLPAPSGAPAAPAPGAASPPPVPSAPPLLTPPPGVAQPGRRLRRRTPWVAIVVAGMIAIVWFATGTGLLGLLWGQ